MYKALILDDEKIVRVALKSMISWEDEGFTVCDAVANGEAGLAAVEKFHPDLLLVDIRMPNMDGITFISRVRALGFDGQIVILSNHKKFDYALEAIRQNVFDYICKTDITPALLRDMLGKIARKLTEQPRKVLPGDQLSSEDNDVRLLRNALEDPSIPGATLEHSYFLVVFQVYRRSISSAGENAMSKNTLKNVISELDRALLTHVAAVSSSQALCIVPYSRYALLREKLPALAGQGAQTISLYMNMNLSLVCTQSFRTTERFLRILRELPRAQALVLYIGYGRPIFTEDTALYQSAAFDIEHWLTCLTNALRSGEARRLGQCLEMMFQQIAVQKLVPEGVLTFLDSLYTYIVVYNYIWLDGSIDELCRLDARRSCAFTLKEYLAVFQSLGNFILSRKLSLCTGRYKQEIAEIAQFVESHLHQKITLSMVAAEVSMSENYISRLFKSETRMNLITYITFCKMEKARDLLLTTEKSIKEIGICLGYDAQPYFNRTFSKAYGISPFEYRNLVHSIFAAFRSGGKA